MVSISQLREAPSENVILLVGTPGSGKSTFCQQAVLQNLAMERPIIYVTTENGPSKAEAALRKRGLGEVEPGLLNFVDAYNDTVGVSVSDRPDTIHADCNDLSSIDIAVSKMSDRIGRKGALLIFDSLTSPYLFSGSEVLRFMRLTLSKFAAEGNSVLACIDEGCSKSEDLGAMISIADGIIKMEVEEGKRVLSVVKHPVVEPARIEVPMAKMEERIWVTELWDPKLFEITSKMMQGKADISFGRREVEDHVNIFWPYLAFWSGMLWDPKRFPELTYEVNKKHGASWKELMPLLPWHRRLLFKLLVPKSFSKVKHMKKWVNSFRRMMEPQRSFIMEYLAEASKTDEHHIRLYENIECCIFENIGATMATFIPPVFAGMCIGSESLRGLERDWNAMETKCVGLGDPYCEFKVVPGEIDELRGFLEKDSSVIERIHERLMHRLLGFMLDGKPLVERPRLGKNVPITAVGGILRIPSMGGERYRMAWRMGGARSGKMLGERLMKAGIGQDEAVNRALHLLEHCNVGKVTADETIKIRENCESFWIMGYTTKWEEPTCYFTTGFLNGFFTAVKNQHVKETKCIAMGDPYCEWEFR